MSKRKKKNENKPVSKRRICSECRREYLFRVPRPLPGKCGDCAALEMGKVIEKLGNNLETVSQQLYGLEQLILLGADREHISLAIYSRRAGLKDDYLKPNKSRLSSEGNVQNRGLLKS